ncbi:TonB-dependent receptor domain-containing protein [Pseudooceanicola nanhaiensis]|uniref:TonB-dependent receptor domain-containing protein n=1 Tax=Pseudooceanicola nanhaiensis TaxID=375761 RepID=UPI001CD7A9D7|nr:TonB-dependent receptor [Pseudooceanicola nanhaiensis]MCA0922055.1 TonB-dependent receptor [Pseudooceanicola nanhaiensis]
MTASSRMRALLLCSTATALVLGAMPASAQDGDAPIVLDEISVAQSKRGVRTDTATAITVVEQEEMEDRQASTISELVDSVPGVTLLNSGTPVGAGINIRGFGANGTYGTDQKVLIMIDGATVGSEELYRVGTQLYTDPELYKQVEVIRGIAGTFEYGSGVIGGMLQLDTKDASDFTGGEVGFKARQTLQYGSNGDEMVSSSILAWQPTKNVEFLGNYTWRQMDVQEDGAGNDIGTEGYELPSWMVKGKVTFGDGDNQTLTLSYTDTQTDEKDVPYDSFGITSGYFGNVDRQTHSKTAALKYTYDSLDTDLINLTAILSYADQEIESEGVSGQTGALANIVNADNQYETTKLTVKNEALFNTGLLSHSLRTGIELIHKKRLEASSAPGGTDKRFAVFAVDDIDFGNGLRLTPALRYETQEVGGDLYDTYTNDALMGGLTARYAFGNGWAVFGSAAYTESLPILDDLGTVAYMTQPEKARSYELGFSYDRDGLFTGGDALRLKVNAYHTEIWDITSYSGVTDATMQGVELEAGYSLASGYYMDVNANLVHGEDATPGASDDYWDGTPADELRVSFGKRWGEMLDVSWEVVADAEMDRSSSPSDGFVVHNFRTTYRPQEGVLRGTEMRFGVENVFDTEYTPHLSTRPAAGRTFKVTLAKTF